MKKHIKIVLFCSLITVIGAMTSCSSYLDKAPFSSVNPEEQYKDFVKFQGAVEELYNCVPSICNRDDNNFFNNGEDEMWQQNASNQGAYVWQVDMGNFWAWQREAGNGGGGSFLDKNPSWDYVNTSNDKHSKSLWGSSWYGIRKCNMLLANLSKMAGTDDEKKAIAGQIYFFRAWFHFSLITYWGGMPYITKILPPDQKLTLPRLTYQATADSCAKDFQKASELLPSNWDDSNYGPGVKTSGKNDLRITKWMALAYLGKNYLYAGSPLMNMSSGGAEEYNKSYCQKAADAFGTLLANCLEENTSGQCQYRLVPWSNYSDIVYTNGQSGRMPGSAIIGSNTYLEAIFRGPNYGGSDQSMNKEYLCAGVLQDRSWSQYPTANYINYFGMSNGLPINTVSKADVNGDNGSGYDTHYPWKNRDPRFYINFAYDTKRMVLSGTSGTTFTYANLYTGGNYTDPAKGSNTGYLLLKYDPVGFNKYDNKYNANQIHISWIRLADVYLMYAEALVQAKQSVSAVSTTFNMTPVQAVNKIRNRVVINTTTDQRLPGISPLFLGSVESFMGELRRERAVELAYEGHRFNDLRRWHLLAKYPYTIKTGISFDRDIPETNHTTPANKFTDKTVPENNKINNLKEYTVLTRYYSEKHYWLPLKRTDASYYLEFPQNPGW
jgi:hypothetical protein